MKLEYIYPFKSNHGKKNKLSFLSGYLDDGIDAIHDFVLLDNVQDHVDSLHLLTSGTDCGKKLF